MDIETIGKNLRLDGSPEEVAFGLLAQEIVRKGMLQIPLKAPLGEDITFDDPKVEGEATPHWRKGKKIATFDFKIETGWRCHLQCQELSTGHMVIPEFTNSYGEVEKDFEIQIPCSRDWHCRTETAEMMMKQMKKKCSKIIRAHLVKCAEEIIAFGVDGTIPQERSLMKDQRELKPHTPQE